LAALVSALVGSSAAQAAILPAYTHTGTPTPTIAGDGTQYTLGYEFTVSQPIVVSAFGYNANTQFTGTHGVALYNTIGSTLITTANVTVPGANSNLTDFVYTTLPTALTLPAGTYRIGGQTNGQGYVYQSGLTGIVNAPDVSYVQGLYTAGYPSYPATANVNWLTVNFLVGEADPLPPAPEPNSLVLFGMGLAGLMVSRKRALVRRNG